MAITFDEARIEVLNYLKEKYANGVNSLAPILSIRDHEKIKKDYAQCSDYTLQANLNITQKDCYNNNALAWAAYSMAYAVSLYAVKVSDYVKDNLIDKNELEMAKAIASYMVDVYLSSAQKTILLAGDDKDTGYNNAYNSLLTFADDANRYFSELFEPRPANK
jgi:hypothetical protein